MQPGEGGRPERVASADGVHDAHLRSASAGGSLRWWQQVLGAKQEYADLDELAAAAPSGSEGLLFLPYLTGERTPHLDPFARGAFVGLSARHDAGHLTRAVMEGVVHSLKDCLEIMTGLGLAVQQVRATGGGARSQLWRQLQADVYGTPVYQTSVDEGPAFGAALLAGVAAGMFGNVEEACAVIQLRPEVAAPDPRRVQLYQRYHEIYRDIYPATAAAMRRLSELAFEATNDATGSQALARSQGRAECYGGHLLGREESGGAGRRPHRRTRCPAATNRPAACLPMPRVAPVIRIVDIGQSSSVRRRAPGARSAPHSGRLIKP